MLSSLPPLAPRDAHNLWYPSLSNYSYHSSVPSHSNASSNHHRQQQARTHPNSPLRTVLSTLRADENAVKARKLATQRFGAGWLRPPGVSKTYQGIIDEKVEREEQEAVQQRELAMLEAQAAAEAEAAQADTEMGMAEGDEDGAEEQDLDNEIPDADDGQDWIDDDDADDVMAAEEDDTEFTEGQGMEIEGGPQERDLDEDVPEAGSYQHTDTDQSLASDDWEAGTGRASPPAMTPAMTPANSEGVTLGSSVFGSSPAVQSQRGGRRSGTFASRRRGREN